MKLPRHILAFIRHGEYDQRPNTPSALQSGALTSIGLQQSLKAAYQLQTFLTENTLPLCPQIECSNALRAWQTADIIQSSLQSEHLNRLTVHIEPDLHERSVGIMTNLTIKEIEDYLSQDPRVASPPKNWKSDSHYCLPCEGAESLMQAGERVKNVIDQHFNQRVQHNQSQVKVVVGHGAAFRHAAYLLGILEFDDIAQLSMHHATPLFFEYSPSSGHWKKIAGEWKKRTTINTPLID
ncbi:histidine phosphatase family protein [Hydrogenovibrio sp. 3SP14C1]|uniref:histidine phosphatase family protein n=1 Tax=Hydrogenovibrio sp. 3SP14C1 TaxID=3038774 RepID=UPI0024172788|nr:histidine phosphatase family protein [Hydrogenovibrio sp. 3SP14C1]MDG4812332.1 histidine phosphatase family protein [Hydrogenovibrio sp. 3SP14C1]